MNRTLSILTMMLALLVGCGDRSVFGGPDGSADSSTMDARVADAGGDARVDLGLTDAGVLDTGVLDTGVLDASLLDIGLPDVGLVDASLLDIGLPDTGVLDASLLDTGPLDIGVPDIGVVDGSLLDIGLPDLGTIDASLDAGTSDLGTSDAGHLGPPPVVIGPTTDLSQAGAYALIGKTGITNVTGSMISGGHLGVSPGSASDITGFALVLDSTGQFSTSPSVVPPSKVYASDYAVPTPTNLTSAILSMQGAYTDAASRVTPDFLNLASGNLAGLTLVPGLYTWGSTVTIPADVTISGGANDIWIFQITGDLDQSTLTHVTLGGSARAENIFWQVSGAVTIQAGAHFEGVILCQTGITLQTGASMHGRALAQSLVALDDNAVTAP